MALIDRIAGALGFIRQSPSGGRPEAPAEATTGDEKALSFPPMTLSPQTLTFAAARAILEEHELGRFQLSAAFARTVLRDPDLAGAMTQRLLALVGEEHCIEAAAATRPAERYARDLAEQFREMVSRGAELDIVRDAIMLGAGVGQKVWYWREDRGEYLEVLEPWPMDSVERDPNTGQWWALTQNGRVPISADDPSWLIYTPWSETAPHFYGAIRQVAEWYLRASNAARDYGRFIELSGQGIIKAYVPSGARKSPEYAHFINSLRNMGRNATVPLPRGKEQHESYDLELEALAADLHKVFVEMLRVAAGKLRLAILGQDLTSQNAKVGTNASSQTGMEVSRAVARADAETWADCLFRQFLVPWAAYRGRPELAPRAYYDLEEESDAKGEAEAANVAADALGKWQSLLTSNNTGRAVDFLEAAERWGVPTTEALTAPENDRGARRLVLVSRRYARAA